MAETTVKVYTTRELDKKITTVRAKGVNAYGRKFDNIIHNLYVYYDGGQKFYSSDRFSGLYRYVKDWVEFTEKFMNETTLC
jgi:hypothetical protein